MKTRLELQETLEGLFVAVGKWLWDPFNFETMTVEDAIRQEARKHVFFQPPETVKITYPAIIYTLQHVTMRHADNLPYMKHKAYKVTIIDKNPDSVLPDKMEELPFVRFETKYSSDNLHHFVYQIYC